MTNFTKIALSIAAIASLNACGGGSSTPTTTTTDTTTTPTTTLDCSTVTYTTPSGATLAGDITSHIKLTKDRLWIMEGLVAVKNNSCLMIEPGTTIAGKDGTAAAASYMIIDKGSKIIAEGTAAEPIIFTSYIAANGGVPAVGQWGGLTLIGKAGNSQVNPYEVNEAFVADATDMADSSGIIKYVQVLNSGITKETDKEINGLSFVGVGSGTVVDNLIVNKSDDDCVELWGGTVNLSNVTLSECTDDHFDIDDGFSGTVTNLKITQTTGNAAIEMSGTTEATFDVLEIVQNSSKKEGGIYFKGNGIGGHFKNATVTDNVADTAGAIHSDATVDSTKVSFSDFTINSSTADDGFTGTDAVNKLLPIFEADTSNILN